jgi:hypothetical protein
MDLADVIRVSLTSELSRTPTEPIRTNVYTRVAWRDRVFHESTQWVTIMPADEWADTDEDRCWLPSFVFRRDPAVIRIVDLAQRYLMALSDDSAAGFDGYQSVDGEADDPTAGVDLQVRALWLALTHDLPLSYINPPPSSQIITQRLRTPTEVIEGRRGTCIDLTLLLAACLEYVEIYPAIFLLEGHAFPAYWRDAAHHDVFREAKDWLPVEESAGIELARIATGAQIQSAQWYLPRSPAAFREVLKPVRAGHLVPIESVWLTRRSSFAEALEEGRKNLRSYAEFNSMIDIVLAREGNVTPLPLMQRSTP